MCAASFASWRRLSWCERLWLDEPAAVTVVTAAGPNVNYSIVRAGKSRSWSYQKGEKAMSKSKPQSKSKPVKKGTRISSADTLAKAGKGAGAELSEEDLKRVTGGTIKIDF